MVTREEVKPPAHTRQTQDRKDIQQRHDAEWSILLGAVTYD